MSSLAIYKPSILCALFIFLVFAPYIIFFDNDVASGNVVGLSIALTSSTFIYAYDVGAWVESQNPMNFGIDSNSNPKS